MPISLNAEMLAHCYDMLAATPAMSRMNLPPSEDVKFRVIRKKDRFAHHEVIGGVHHIAISSKLVGTFETLVPSMAHEMLHIFQDMTGMPRDDGPGFQKMADKICRELAFDRLTF